MFEGVDLGDSWVLRWQTNEATGQLVFEIEASLWPGHPDYERPPSEDYTCYKQARLIFEGVKTITGLVPMREVKPLSDPDGSLDYGNIEGFRAVGDDTYEFSGEFGDLRVKATGVHLEIGHSSTVAT